MMIEPNDPAAAANGPTPEMNDSTPAPRMRASDLDRRKVAAILHSALSNGQLTLTEFDERSEQTWAAKHLDELDALTVDLLGSSARSVPDAVSVLQSSTGLGSLRVTESGGQSWAVAVFSGFERNGVWTVPRQLNAIAVFGGGELDLRHANLGASKVTITAVAIFGGINIIVPDDIEVKVNGAGVFGGFSDSRRWDGQRPPLPADAPIVVINGAALFGGITVERKPSGPQQIDAE